MRTEVAELVDGGERRDRRGRRRVAREQRAELVRTFHASGLTQAAFARREGLNAKTLSHWLKVGARAPAALPPVRFARVSLPAATVSDSAPLEVRLADGTLICGRDAHAVATLVRALRG